MSGKHLPQKEHSIPRIFLVNWKASAPISRVKSTRPGCIKGKVVENLRLILGWFMQPGWGSKKSFFWCMFICFLHLPGTFALPTINLLCHLPTYSPKMCQCFSFFYVLQLSHLIMQHFGSKMVYYKQPAQQAFPLEFFCENCSPLPLPLLLFFPAFLQYLERKR